MNAAKLASMALFVFTMAGCSKIEENNDPILGVWTYTEQISEENSEAPSTLKEWIFNDVYMGRYHIYENNVLIFYHDFDWSVNGDTYTISYRGDIDLTNEVVILSYINGECLECLNGSLFAWR